jgi:uncharacterized membrane protein (UPF0182 family)
VTATSPQVLRRRRIITVTVIVILAVLAIAAAVFSSLYTESLWFTQLGFSRVLYTQWVASAAFFLVGFTIMAFSLWLGMYVAYRIRPVYARLGAQMDRYQQAIDPVRRTITIVVPLVIGVFGGLAALTHWQETLLFLNASPTGTTDPQFHKDISFYLFDLPFYQALIGFLSAVVILTLIVSTLTHLVYGSISFAPREVRVARGARIQLAIIAALYLGLQAVSLYFDQFATMNDPAGLITGASYTSVHATIPGLQILSIIAALVALLFVVTAFTGRWRLPVVGVALLVVSALVLTLGYPFVMQRFIVDPSERSLEQPYITDNIDFTRKAYGVDKLQSLDYNATTSATPGALRQDAETTANIRIIDPALVSDSFAQLEQFKQYYAFRPDLDVDRYVVNGKSQDTVVAARELNQKGIATTSTTSSWYNDTLVYTHGYGLVAAYGTERTVEGQPVFLQAGIPSTGKLGEFEPRIYFGETSPKYSIVGGTSGKDVELDYPANGDDKQQTYTTYAGTGGPKLDSFFTRLLYAFKFGSEEILLSDAVNNSSQILYDRNPALRVQKVAPYLTIDSDPYPSVVDGHVVWIVDGYTTSDQYPYSRQESFSNVIADQQTPATGFARDTINYIRNSVKATVDAYSGKVTLYAWDTTDPIIKAWSKVYPGTIKSVSDMSSQLMSHVRYPADLFKAQRAILGQYHVTDAGSFYSQDDSWTTPNDPTAPAGTSVFQQPYYLTMKVPGQKSPSFSLYSTYIPNAAGTNSRNVLTGYLVVDSDAGSTAGKISSNYGQLRMLTLPKDVTVPGPGQVQNNFNADPTVSKELNLLSQGSTDVLKGNLLTLPVGGGLLYVQPVYVKSTGNTSYPLLKKILVAFGDRIAFETTLPAALDVLFGGNSGVNQPTNDTPANPDTGGTNAGGGTTGGSTTGNAALKAALAEASAALKAREAARVAGDWAAFGKADAELTNALSRALAATN